jgi:ribosomal protein L34E
MRHDGKVVVFSKKKLARWSGCLFCKKILEGIFLKKIGYIFENSFKIYIYLKFRSSPAL